MKRDVRLKKRRRSQFLVMEKTLTTTGPLVERCLGCHAPMRGDLFMFKDEAYCSPGCRLRAFEQLTTQQEINLNQVAQQMKMQH